MDQICFGVRDLHKNGVFHRDLKPANILILQDDRIVVSDLGLARFEHRDTTVLTNAVQHLGTEDYLAPEQKHVDGAIAADGRTDIYQLGKIIYSLYTSRSPALIDYSLLPQGLAHVVRMALAEHPEERYQTMREFHRALRLYRDSKDPHHNCQEILTNLVARLESKQPPISHHEISQVLELLTHSTSLDADQTIKCFHVLPVSWLDEHRMQYVAAFQPILKAYAGAIEERVGGYYFAFEDEVCERMSPIYETATSIPIRVLALRALMIAADKLGRHAAAKSVLQIPLRNK